MLQFPTFAEQVIASFEASKNIPLVKIAMCMGGEREDGEGFPPSIVFVFDDDTRLVIRGRGKNHTYKAELP